MVFHYDYGSLTLKNNSNELDSAAPLYLRGRETYSVEHGAALPFHS